MTSSFSGIVRVTLFALLCFGIATPSTHTITPKETALIGALSAAILIPVGTVYLAVTQDENPTFKEGTTTLQKFINWYRTVVAGHASKKIQVVQIGGKIKDTYTQASGYTGKFITWYETYEKDLKKALGLGSMPALMIFGVLKFPAILELLANLATKGLYGECVKVAPIKNPIIK